MNINDEKTASRKPNGKDKQEIKEILKSNFGNEARYIAEQNVIILCNNDILIHPEMLLLLVKYKIFIQPSLF